MNFKRILCPIDFSNFNQAANEYASILAKASGAKIVYFHAFLPDIPYGSFAYVDTQLDEKQLLKLLEETKPTMDGVEASYEIEFGPAADQITCYANENDIDLIVIGTHGRTGLKRVVMGSVAEAVVRRAECPVLAIKSDAKVLQEN